MWNAAVASDKTRRLFVQPVSLFGKKKISIVYLVGIMTDFISLYSIGKIVSTLFCIDLFAFIVPFVH